MARVSKSNKGSGVGRRKQRVKKTIVQRQAEASGRLLRSAIEKQVRRDNPQMTEKQISVEVKRRMAERKKPKSEGSGYSFRYS